jgi:Ricin-type beta-trefoil lectin domain-like
MYNEANGLGLPIFTMEDGVSYTTQGGPQDPYYGVNPPGPSRILSRQGMIDLNKVEENIPNHLALGMEWWAGEATSVPGTTGVKGYWATPGIGLFDALTQAGNPMDNAALPVMAAMGGKLDPTLAYTFVNAANSRVLETNDASTAPGAALGTGQSTGITSLHQQWRILAQGADPDENATTFPTPMDHRGDGFFQIVNMNQVHGVNVLDTNGATASGTPVVQNPQASDVFAIGGAEPDQEWDVLPAGNCGDVPANCTTPPLITSGDGNFYMIVNKATGNVLATSGTGAAEQQAPAATSNGDWMEPPNKGQLWRIVTARITASPADLLTDQLALVGSANGGSFTAQLHTALDALAAGDTADACVDVSAYANHVRAQSGKHLSATLANHLLADAQVIDGLLGCT